MIVSDLARFLMALAALSTSGCGRAVAPPASIVLNGFSESNYTKLERRLSSKVCVKGKLSIDSMGVYFPLQPLREDGIISLGFSRINVALNRAAADQQGLRNGGIHTICGLLEDATPFQNCRTNDCKWYKLVEAWPRRRF